MQKSRYKKVKFIGKGGEGGVEIDGKVYFFPYLIDDEIIELENDYEPFKIKKIIKKSPHRRKPECKVYTLCGGCNFLHINYPHQLELKKRIFIHNLKAIANYLPDFEIKIIPSKKEFHYRTKTIFKIRDGKLGFFKRKSNELVEIENCLLLPEAIRIELNKIKQLISNISSGEILALTNGDEISIYLKKNNKKTKYLTGKKEIIFKFENFKFTVKPVNFIQSNLYTLKRMLELLSKALKYFDEELTTIELFSGAGFFSVPIAKRQKKVILYENNDENIKLLKHNLMINLKKENYRIEKRDLYREDIKDGELFFADPPRSGFSRKLINKISSKKTEGLIYFSCDSATFSRDLKKLLKNGFILKELTIIDNFPQTDHFEIFSVFKRDR